MKVQVKYFNVDNVDNDTSPDDEVNGFLKQISHRFVSIHFPFGSDADGNAFTHCYITYKVEE